MKIFLYLLSLIYLFITKVRNFLFEIGILKGYKAIVPVISVGNVTVGGNGKTPCVIYLCQVLQKLGKKPVVLSRGYGGKKSDPYEVSESDNVSGVGDEPILILRKAKCPVVVAKSRAAGARYIEKNALGDVIILDDGFQHRWLHRDLDIVCIFSGTNDAVRLFKKGELLPLGRFREERESALKRAGCVIFTQRTSKKTESKTDELRSYIPSSCPSFNSFFTIDKPLSVNSPVCAVAAIANPEGFFETIETLGLSIGERMIFPDHYQFTVRDVAVIRSKQMPIVCTEKDWVKLKEFDIRDLHVMSVSFVVEPEEEFVTLIKRSIIIR